MPFRFKKSLFSFLTDLGEPFISVDPGSVIFSFDFCGASFPRGGEIVGS